METFLITSKDESIKFLKKKDARLAVVIDLIGDITCHIHTDGYAFIVEEIVGQMLSNKAADVICERLYKLCDGSISPENISKLAVEQLREIGLSNAKSQYILNFNQAVVSGELDLESLESLSDEEVIKKLTAIRGIGTWTAKMYLLFVLRRNDILPFEDGAFMASYKWMYNTKLLKPSDVKKRCKKWSPYTSIGARYLYRALDTGLTKKPFKEYMKENNERSLSNELGQF